MCLPSLPISCGASLGVAARRRDPLPFSALLCLWNKKHVFNKIAIQARAQMAEDKEAGGLSRVHMYDSVIPMCILPLWDNCLFILILL